MANVNIKPLGDRVLLEICENTEEMKGRNAPIKISVALAIFGKVRKARATVVHVLRVIPERRCKIMVKRDIDARIGVIFACDQVRKTQGNGIFLHETRARDRTSWIYNTNSVVS